MYASVCPHKGCVVYCLANVDKGTFKACNLAAVWCQVCTVRYFILW